MFNKKYLKLIYTVYYYNLHKKHQVVLFTERRTIHFCSI